MKFLHLALLIIAIQPVVAVRINEIMYDPYNETQEFVEIKGTNNLTNYTIGDKSFNDTLTLLKIVEGNYSLIVLESFNHSGVNASVYSVQGKIGNGLGNSGDSVFLYYNNSLVVSVSYNDTAREGFSLEYRNGSWQESFFEGGTPGQNNSANETNNATENNSTNQSIETCNVSINIELEKRVFESEKIVFKNALNNESFGYIITYWIEDVYGIIVKSKRNTTNSNEKRYTPGPETKAYIVKNKLSFVNCTNTGKNQSEKLVVYKGEELVCEENLCEEELKEIKELKRQKKGSGGGGGNFVLPKASVESFYTRKKAHSPLIKLFARVKGRGLYVLVLTSTLEEYNRTVIVNSSETVDLEVKAIQGKNLYVLEVVNDHGKTEDSEKLVVEFPEEKQIEVVAKVKERPKPEEKKSNAVQEPKKVVPEITSNVVYEQNNTDYKKPLLFAVLFVVALIATVGGVKNYINRAGFDQSNGKTGDAGKAGRRLDQDKHDL